VHQFTYYQKGLKSMSVVGEFNDGTPTATSLTEGSRPGLDRFAAPSASAVRIPVHSERHPARDRSDHAAGLERLRLAELGRHRQPEGAAMKRRMTAVSISLAAFTAAGFTVVRSDLRIETRVDSRIRASVAAIADALEREGLQPEPLVDYALEGTQKGDSWSS
jgi:hypothetical protein